jgi:hypothetical protein
MEAAGVAYAREQVLGLTPSRLAALADLTAAAVMVARGHEEAVGAPLRARQEADHLWERVQAEARLAENGVGDANLQAMYATRPEYELTVRHLIVLSARYETDATRADARAKAERALERIRAGEPFPDVAAEVSEEPGAEGRQGLLEPGRRGAWVNEFWDAASALEVGAVSDVVETQYGFHVLRLEDRQEVPFEEVRDRVAMDAARLMGPLQGSVTLAPLPPGFAPADGVDALEGESAAAATIGGGAVTLGAVLDYAATLEPARWRAVLDGEPGARDAAARDAARARWVGIRADDAGIAPDPARAGEIQEAWSGEVLSWAAAFGFRPGLPDEAIREAALAALSTTGQSAQLARDAITARRGLLERRYGTPVTPQR